MKKFLKDETAEFAIDAIFGITFFMITLIAIMFMALIIRVQSNIQYALGQTAKEISGYYYLADKLGLAAITANDPTKRTGLDTTIQSVLDFSGSAEKLVNQGGETIESIKTQVEDGTTDFEAYVNVYKQSSADLQTSFKEAESKAKTMGNNIKALANDPKGQAKQILSVFAKTAANKAVNQFIAPVVCETLMSKYLSSGNYNNIDEYYDAVGIKSPDFTGSQFLADKRSIKVQITYELDVSKYTLGFVKTPMTFRQAASTAAWVRPDETNLAALDMEDMGYKGE